MQQTTVRDRMTKNLAMRTKFRQPFILHLNREHIAFPLHHDLIKQTMGEVYIHQHPRVMAEGSFLSRVVYNERASNHSTQFPSRFYLTNIHVASLEVVSILAHE